MRPVLVLLAGAALSVSVIPAAHAAAPADKPVPPVANAWSDTKAPPASDNVIVHWDSGVGRADRAQARDDVNTEDFQNLGNAKFQLLTLADGQDPNQAVQELAFEPRCRIRES